MLLPEGLATQFAKDGKITALAIDRSNPPPLLPTVPIYAEAGLSQYKPLTAWSAIVAPAGTPRSIVAQLTDDIASVLKALGSACHTHRARCLADRQQHGRCRRRKQTGARADRPRVRRMARHHRMQPPS